MESLLHWALEDNHIKTSRFGNGLMMKAEFQDKENHAFLVEGRISNDLYVVTSLKIYDIRTGIEQEMKRADETTEEE